MDISFTVCLFVVVVAVVVVILCVCTVTDFSADDKASGVKFCTAVHHSSASWARSLPFWRTLLPRSPKSDEQSLSTCYL